MQDLVAAVVQLRSTPDVARNITRAEELTRRAIDDGAQLVVLPENYAGIGPAGSGTVHRADPKDLLADLAVAPFAQLTRDHAVAVVLGGVPLAADARTSHNACLTLADGAIRARYDKIHCFEATMPDGSVVSELELTVPGERPVAVDLGSAILGLSICYDLRFPELYRTLVDAGAEVLTAPSAFTFPTGAAHWALLNRTRAVESQCFMVSAAQWGVHAPGRHSWGHSMIVDPWGVVLAQVSDGEGHACAHLRSDVLEQVRRALPALEHRRLSRETSALLMPLSKSESPR